MRKSIYFVTTTPTSHTHRFQPTPTSHTHLLLTTPTSHTHTFHPLSTIVIHTLNLCKIQSMDDNCGEWVECNILSSLLFVHFFNVFRSCYCIFCNQILCIKYFFPQYKHTYGQIRVSHGSHMMFECVNTMVVFKMHDSVPSMSYSSVCNVLRLWSISLIPTYRVYLHSMTMYSIYSNSFSFDVFIIILPQTLKNNNQRYFSF